MMQSIEQTQYLIDSNSVKTHVVLPLEEYEEMIHQILDARDAVRMPQLVEEARENAQKITIEELRNEFGLEQMPSTELATSADFGSVK
jgi:aryl carrier-like protein